MAGSAPPQLILNHVVVNGAFGLKKSDLNPPFEVKTPLPKKASRYVMVGQNRLLISFNANKFKFDIYHDISYLLNNPLFNLNTLIGEIISRKFLDHSEYELDPESTITAGIANCQCTLKIPNCDHKTLRSHLIPLIAQKVQIKTVSVIEEGVAKQEYPISSAIAQDLVSATGEKKFTNIHFRFVSYNTFTVRIQPNLQETSQNLCFIFTGYSKLVEHIFDFFEHVAKVYHEGNGELLNN